MHVIATAGHVDHGKSTLIRSLTGMEPDRWSEERRRGMTIDLGFAWTTTADGTTLAFVDVPGHERFVPNMLAGIGSVPAVMFVVAADEGWMPQSSEHLQALHALGVRHGILVVTRSDLADPEPAAEQARHHLRDTSLAQLPVIRVSGATGDGVAELRSALHTLVDGLARPDHHADPRLWVDRAFTVHGAGTVVTGTLAAGTLRTGQQLLLHPHGHEVTVRGMQCLGTEASSAGAVARVALNLRGTRLENVRRGDVLLAPGRWLSTDVVDVRLRGTESRELPRQLMLHMGSAAVSARVRPLGPDTARLSLRTPLPLRIGDRALLRDPGSHRVPAGVTMLDVQPPPLQRRGAAGHRARELEEIGDRADGAAELRRRRVVRTDDLIAMGATPPSGAPQGGGWLLDPAHRDTLAARLIDLLSEYRRKYPLEDGMPVEAVRRALELPDSALLPSVLRAITSADVTTRDGRVCRGPAPLPEAVRNALSTLHSTLTDKPFVAPTAEELDELGLGSKEIAAAVRAGELLKLDQGIVLLPDALEQAVQRLSQLPAPFTASQAKKALATTRRVAIPLLETLAHRRYTERLADGSHRLR
ncbi:selenocysteine-specific elongation factor [Halopolyspora algeriensis]|uniref:Selenocysteine-specific elongation factor n=1 Tax=Halopolyspora algeriensis TaxID=1500506 RepID=A0A368VVN4_9ACTN|nr:selenocysteine-specific translation elongation factor [Halopolyspora algeriensis]RCW46156.1 selenocysteine-specific elongation factor [Halopolyspora algeriensis]TQM55559.1 selenocysteine-specific elongation factor [Halopolyspora algeriensis]